MNIVDVVIVALILLVAIRGYLRGLFREVFSLLGLVVGFFFAARYHTSVSLFWQDSWQFSPMLLQVLSFISLFFVIYLLFNIVGLLLHRSAHFLFLGTFNRLGGVLIGAGKAAVLLGLVVFVLISRDWIPENMATSVKEAKLVQPLFEFGDEVVQFGRSKMDVSPSETSFPRGLRDVDHRKTRHRQRV